MKLVPQLVVFSIVSLVLAGLAVPAFAGGLMPGNGGAPILPLASPPAPAGAVTLTDSFPTIDPFEQKFGVHDGRLDFFSAHPEDSGSFKPLLRGGVGDGGVQLQLKW